MKAILIQKKPEILLVNDTNEADDFAINFIEEQKIVPMASNLPIIEPITDSITESICQIC